MHVRIPAALLLAAALSATPASASGCPLFTDPAGDETVLADTLLPGMRPALDMLALDVESGSGTLTATVHVRDLARMHEDSPGGLGWYLYFSAADGTRVRIEANQPMWGAPYFVALLDGSPSTGVAVSGSIDVANDTVTITAPYADLAPIASLADGDTLADVGMTTWSRTEPGQPVGGALGSGRNRADRGPRDLPYVLGSGSCP